MEAARRIAIFAALGWECRPFTRRLRRVRRQQRDGLTTWSGGAGRHEVEVIRTGMGPQRAAEAARRAATAGGYGLFLSSGCAGALRSGIAPGDLVRATSLIAGDGSRRFETDPQAGAALERAAQRAGVPLHRGAVLTVTAPLLTPSSRDAAAGTGAIAVEMEGAAIAEQAVASRIPVASLRSILDPIDTDFTAAEGLVDLQTGSLRLLRTALRLAGHPRLAPQLARLQRMQRAAEDALDRWFAAWIELL